MGHGDDGAFILLQMMFQPGHRFGIQVVGRFIQQQDIRFGQQQAGQGYPAAFAAGEDLDRGIAGRAAQGIHGQVRRLSSVQASCLSSSSCSLLCSAISASKSASGSANFSLISSNSLEHIHNRLDGFFHHLLDGLSYRQMRFLVEHTHRITW